MSNLYGFVDDESKELKSAGSVMKFGLNQNIRMVSFKYNDMAGQDNTPGEAIDIEFKFNPGDEKPQRMRLFPVSRVYAKSGGELQPGEDGYDEALALAAKHFNAQVVHILHRFVEKETLAAALSQPTIVDFKSFALTCERLLPVNYAEIPLDIFCQYSWNIKGDNERSYLEIPKNMKQGPWLSKHIPGDFEMSEEAEGIVYVDKNNEANVHVFTRTASFRNGNFGNQQTEEGNAAKEQGAVVNMGTAGAPAGGAPKGKW